MDNQKGNGFWKWLIALLILCNAALIATIWLRPGTPPPPPAPPVRPAGNLSEQLALTPAQQTRFDSIRTDQRQKIDSLKKLAGSLREQFFNGLKEGSHPDTQLDSVAGQLGNYHKQIELETYRHFAAIRQILTDSQRAGFDRTIGDVLHRLPEQPHYRGDGLAAPGPGQPAEDTEPANNRRGPDDRPRGDRRRRREFGPPPPGDDPMGPPPPPRGPDNR